MTEPRHEPPSPWRLSHLAVLMTVLFLVAGCAAAATPQARSPGENSFDDGQGGGITNPGFPAGAPLPTAAPAGAPGAEAGLRIAWTGRLQLQVADLDASLINAEAAISGLGGFASASRRSGGDQPVASVTYRIPSDRWTEGLAALRRLAVEVVDEQTDSSDLASQIVDIEARLRNLRASETALQAIAAQATRITDVLEVQSRLTETRGQIESLAAQQAGLTDRVAYGTLSVTFGTEVVAVTQAARQWDPAREVDAATASLLAFLQQVASGAIWFAIVWLPVLLVAVVLVAVLVQVWRRIAPRLPRLERPEPTYAWTGPGWTGVPGGAPGAVPPPPPAPGAAPAAEAPPAPGGPAGDAGKEATDRPGG